jgi:uncharacterized protein involved in exopolysaccharide biosynthesis
MDKSTGRDGKPVVAGYFIESSAFLDTGAWSITEVWRFVSRARIFVLLGCILGLLLGGTYFVAVDKVYRATVLTVPAPSSVDSSSGLLGQFGGLASLAGISVSDDQSELRVALALIGSRNFLREFVLENRLIEVFFPRESGEYDEDVTSGEHPLLEDAIELVQDDLLEVVRNRDEGTISIEVEWKDPVLAASWANEIVARLNARMRASAIEEANKSIAFLNKEVNQTTIVELKTAIYDLIETHIKSRMIANVSDEYVLRVLDPAVVSGPDRYVRPILVATLMTGAILGMLIALGLAAFFLRHRDEAPPRS